MVAICHEMYACIETCGYDACVDHGCCQCDAVACVHVGHDDGEEEEEEEEERLKEKDDAVISAWNMHK